MAFSQRTKRFQRAVNVLTSAVEQPSNWNINPEKSLDGDTEWINFSRMLEQVVPPGSINGPQLSERKFSEYVQYATQEDAVKQLNTLPDDAILAGVENNPVSPDPTMPSYVGPISQRIIYRTIL